MKRNWFIALGGAVLTASAPIFAQNEARYVLMVPPAATTPHSGCHCDRGCAPPDETWLGLGSYSTDKECEDTIPAAIITISNTTEVTSNDWSKTAKCVPMPADPPFAKFSVGITSLSTPSTLDYEQGSGPSGFNLGDLPDRKFSDFPPSELGYEPTSNSIVYGPNISTENIDSVTSCYLMDDSGNMHERPAEDCSSQ